MIDQRLLFVSQRVVSRSCGVNFVLAFVGVFYLADGVDQVVDRVRIDKVGVNFKCCRDGRSTDGHREAFVNNFNRPVVLVGNGERRKAEAQLRCNRQVDRFAHSGGLFVRGDRAVFRLFHIHGIEDILPHRGGGLVAVHGDRVADAEGDGFAADFHAPAAEGHAHGGGEITGGQIVAVARNDRNAGHVAAAAVRVKADGIERAAVRIAADGAKVLVALEGVRRRGKDGGAVFAGLQVRVGADGKGVVDVLAFADRGRAVPLHAGSNPVCFHYGRVVDRRPDAHLAAERQEARGHVAFIAAFGDTDGVGNITAVGGKSARYADGAAGDGDAAVFLVAVRAAADARRLFGAVSVVV